MKIYRDIFSNDELCSDSFPVKLIDGVIYEFTGKHVVRKEGDVKLEGANAVDPSLGGEGAEDVGEAVEESVERGIDIVLNHRLVNMTSVYGDTKVFKDWVKEYMKKLLDRLKADEASAEEMNNFKTKMQEWVGSLIKKERFKNLEFYTGDGDNASEGQLAIIEYRDVNGEEKPILMLVKQGLEEEKF